MEKQSWRVRIAHESGISGIHGFLAQGTTRSPELWIADYADPMTFLDVFADEENDAQYHNPAYNETIAGQVDAR